MQGLKTAWSLHVFKHSVLLTLQNACSVLFIICVWFATLLAGKGMQGLKTAWSLHVFKHSVLLTLQNASFKSALSNSLMTALKGSTTSV